MNRRTGNVRRVKTKRRYHDRRQEPRGIEVSDVQGESIISAAKAAELVAKLAISQRSCETLQKALAAASRENASRSASMVEAAKAHLAKVAELEEAANRAIVDGMSRARCPCGLHLPSMYGSSYVCHCGRRYATPTLDVFAVLNRIDALEDRVKKLEAVIRVDGIKEPA